MILNRLAFSVESVILGAPDGGLQSPLLNAAQGRCGRSEGACGEHGRWCVVCGV